MRRAELREVIEAARSGDADAFADLVREFHSLAAATAYAWLRDAEAVRDVCQESFADAWRLLPQLHEPDAFPGWLRRIVVKHCDRRTRRSVRPSLPIDSVGDLVADAPGPAAQVEVADEARRVRLAIEALPPNERVVVTLHYLGGRPERDVAAWLDLPLGTVKTRLHRARARLRREMDAMAEDTMRRLRPAVVDDTLPLVVRFYIALRGGDTRSVRALAATEPALVNAYESWDEELTVRGLLPIAARSTPLVRAIERDDPAMVECLLALGADPNHRCGCVTDEPPLWTAVVTGRAPMVRLLLDAGANPDQAAFNGQTPLAVARGRQRDDLALMLVDAGADTDTSAARDAVPARGATVPVGATVETGIKALDLLAPIGPGDRVLMVTEPWVGAMVLLGELSRRFADRGVRVAWTGHTPRPWDEVDLAAELAELGLTDRVQLALGAPVPDGSGLVALFTAPGHDASTDAALRTLAETQPDAIAIVVTAWTEARDRTAATPGAWDACIAFDRRLAERRIYPALDARGSWSRRRAGDSRHDRLAELTAQALVDLDSDVGRRIAAFVSQPFFTAEPFNARPGEYVCLRETLDGIERLLNG